MRLLIKEQAEYVAMYDSIGDTEYTYDSPGRITSVTTYRTPGEGAEEFFYETAQGDTAIYTYEYDFMGNRTAVIKTGLFD